MSLLIELFSNPELLWFDFTRSVIGVKKFAPPTQPIMQNQNQSWLGYTRFPALGSHWFIVLFTFLVIGHCNCLKTALVVKQLRNWRENSLLKMCLYSRVQIGYWRTKNIEDGMTAGAPINFWANFGFITCAVSEIKNTRELHITWWCDPTDKSAPYANKLL